MPSTGWRPDGRLRPKAAWVPAWVGAMLVLLAWAGPACARWLTLHTPHLRVHFRPGYEQTALQAARVGEEAVKALEGRLGHVPQDPIHLVLADVSDVPNGFTEVTFYSRVVIFPAFPVGLGYSTGLSPHMEDWLRLVVTHEVVHAVHLDMNEGAARGLRGLFGHVPGLSTPNLFQPPAWLEGIATFEETKLVRGGRGGDPLFDMYLRTAVLAGTLPVADQALGAYDLEEFEPAGHRYLYGYAWFDFVNRQLGASSIRRLQKGWAALRYARPDDATKDALRLPFAATWEQMQEDLRRQFEAQVRAIQAMGATNPHALPSQGWVVTAPRFSPDGRRVVYAAQGPYVEDLRVLELETGRDRQLVAAAVSAPGGLDWTPDGRLVIYAALVVEGQRSFSDLFAVDAESGRARRLTRGLRAYAPAVSPDGGRVAFVARDGLRSRLMLLGLDGNEGPQVAWEPPEGWQVLSLAWRPGPQLAASVWRPGGMADVLLLRETRRPGGAAAFEVAEWVTTDGAANDRPAWSADGRYLLFHSDRGGVYNLHAFDRASGRRYRLTNVLTGAFDPAVSPDGSMVVFSWFQPGGYRLARLGWDELRWEPVPEAAEPQVTDASPDGSAGAAGPVAGPDEGGLPEGWFVEEYRPGDSLRPRFWFPILDEDWAGPQVGASTAGSDALGQRAFAAEAAVGLLSGEPRLYAGYAQALADGEGPVVTVEALQAPVPVEREDWWRVGQLRASAVWQWPGYLSAAALGVAFDHVVEQVVATPAGAGVEQPAHAYGVVSAVLSAARLEADHRRALVDRLDLAAETRLYEDAKPQRPQDWAVGIVSLQRRLQWPGGSAVRAGVAAAASGPRLLLSLGGEAGAFSLRGFKPDSFWADVVAVGQLGVRRRLIRVKRGAGDTPLFVDDVGVELFVEAATGWNWGQEAGRGVLEPAGWGVVADAGAELQLPVVVDFGRMGLMLRLGVAYPLSPPGSARWYLSFQTN